MLPPLFRDRTGRGQKMTSYRWRWHRQVAVLAATAVMLGACAGGSGETSSGPVPQVGYIADWLFETTAGDMTRDESKCVSNALLLELGIVRFSEVSSGDLTLSPEEVFTGSEAPVFMAALGECTGFRRMLAAALEADAENITPEQSICIADQMPEELIEDVFLTPLDERADEMFDMWWEHLTPALEVCGVAAS
jgi:hypothetical protein